MAIKATKEGPRKILIVAARASQINIRDAVSGLLLRIIEVPEKITVYSLLIDRGVLHCGTNQNELISFDFTVIFRQDNKKRGIFNFCLNFQAGIETGRKLGGTGAICLKQQENLLFSGCYDGHIYVHDINSGLEIGKIQGPGKMLLCLEIVENKVSLQNFAQIHFDFKSNFQKKFQIIAAVKDKSAILLWDIPQNILQHLNSLR